MMKSECGLAYPEVDW